MKESKARIEVRGKSHGGSRGDDRFIIVSMYMQGGTSMYFAVAKKINSGAEKCSLAINSLISEMHV